MKEKKTTIPPAGAVKPTTANKNRLLMMALPIIVAVLLLFVPVPEGLPPYAWHYFAIFVGVIVGLIFEPLPGAVIGITGVVVIACAASGCCSARIRWPRQASKWLAPPLSGR
jgi:L-tartrate/succinate antiporter